MLLQNRCARRYESEKTPQSTSRWTEALLTQDLAAGAACWAAHIPVTMVKISSLTSEKVQMLLLTVALALMASYVDATVQYITPGVPTPVYHRGMKAASSPPYQAEINITEPVPETFHLDIKAKNTDGKEEVYPIDAEIQHEDFFSKKWTGQHRRDLMKREEAKRTFSPKNRFSVVAKGKKPFERRPAPNIPACS